MKRVAKSPLALGTSPSCLTFSSQCQSQNFPENKGHREPEGGGCPSERLQCSLSYQVRQEAPGQSKEVGTGAAQENGVEEQAGEGRGERPETRKKGRTGR